MCTLTEYQKKELSKIEIGEVFEPWSKRIRITTVLSLEKKQYLKRLPKSKQRKVVWCEGIMKFKRVK